MPAAAAGAAAVGAAVAGAVAVAVVVAAGVVAAAAAAVLAVAPLRPSIHRAVVCSMSRRALLRISLQSQPLLPLRIHCIGAP